MTKVWILTIELFSLAIILSSAYFLGGALGSAVKDLKSGESIRQLEDYSAYELPTEVFDVHGEKITEFFIKKRTIVSYDELPEKLVDAFVAIEDHRFYDHTGVDFLGIARAVFENVKAFGVVQGGSTISQQLAKLFYTDRGRNLKRKLDELCYTLKIEKRFTKTEILERYLNKIYFGHGVYGVQEAGEYFFNKKPDDLSMAEIAMLVSIPAAPNRYSPLKDIKAAKARHNIIFNRISEMGLFPKANLKKANYVFWKQMEKRIVSGGTQAVFSKREDKAPYFSEYVRQLAEKFVTEKLKKNKNYLYTGGLKIYTSLDLKKQRMAHNALKPRLILQDRIFNAQHGGLYHFLKYRHTDLMNFIGLSFGDPNYHFRAKDNILKTLKQLQTNSQSLAFLATVLGYENMGSYINRFRKEGQGEDLSLKAQGALVCMNPFTGHIVAMVGGRRFTQDSQFNRVFAKRQPGSTFKVFVYGAAINSRRFNPYSIIDKKIVRTTFQDGWSYGVQEYTYGIPLKDGLRLSINDAAVNLIRKLTPRRVIDFASPLLGIDKNRLPEDPSLALGTGEVSPLEMCRAISVYANGGMKVTPIAITRILDRHGHTLKDFEKEAQNNSERLIPARVAHIMTAMLRGVINNGTGKRARISRPAAGKTGTTQNTKDAWFVGYTPNLATVVWVGFDRNMSLGYRQYGGRVAAPVWARFMNAAHRDLPYKRFKKSYLYGYSSRVVRRKTIRETFIIQEKLPEILQKIDIDDITEPKVIDDVGDKSKEKITNNLQEKKQLEKEEVLNISINLPSLKEIKAKKDQPKQKATEKLKTKKDQPKQKATGELKTKKVEPKKKANTGELKTKKVEPKKKATEELKTKKVEPKQSATEKLKAKKIQPKQKATEKVKAKKPKIPEVKKQSLKKEKIKSPPQSRNSKTGNAVKSLDDITLELINK